MGMALIVVGLPLRTALTARVTHGVAPGGFWLAAAPGLRKIIRTPGER
jgi:hypothetical protein